MQTRRNTKIHRGNEKMTLTINQATSITLTIILFVGLGGLNAEGYQFLAICVASAVSGYAMVAIADCLYSLIEGR